MLVFWDGVWDVMGWCVMVKIMLGKLMLYHLSYYRIFLKNRPHEETELHTTNQTAKIIVFHNAFKTGQKKSSRPLSVTFLITSSPATRKINFVRVLRDNGLTLKKDQFAHFLNLPAENLCDRPVI